MGIEGIALIENPTAVGKLASMMHEEACLKRKKKEKKRKTCENFPVDPGSNNTIKSIRSVISSLITVDPKLLVLKRKICV